PLSPSRSARATAYSYWRSLLNRLNRWKADRRSTGLDRDLQDSVSLVREQLVGRHDVVELVLVRDQHAEVDAARCHYVHQATHPLLAAREQGGDDPVIAETSGEGGRRNLQVV